MNILQEIQKLAVKKKVPEIKTGYTVKVHQRIKEGDKERVQIFEGLVIKINSGHGADKTITVRKVFSGIGVEKIFPLYSTNIVKIEVRKTSKIRRAKLYYMRDRFGKSARLKETLVSDKIMEESIEELAAQKAKEEAGQESEETAQVEDTVQVEETAPVEEAAQAEEAPAEEEAPKE